MSVTTPSGGKSRRRPLRIEVGQVWQDADGIHWEIVNLHRKDGQADIRPAGRRAGVPCDELARDYTLVEGVK